MNKKDDMPNVIKDATVKGTIAVADGAVKGFTVEQLLWSFLLTLLRCHDSLLLVLCASTSTRTSLSL